MTRLPVAGAVAIYVGAVISLAGMYWDGAWHTDFGRDTFWSPPHLVLYTGIMLIGGAVGLWSLMELRHHRSILNTLSNRNLLLAGAGMAVVLAAAPIDDLWHELFGRDSVVWSPPHLLGLSGVFAAMAAILLEIRSIPGRMGRMLTTMGTVTLLGSLLVLVFEYDADVPQFAVIWYLPIVTGAAAMAFALARRVTDDPWIATRAAAVYTILLGAVSLGLRVMDHTAPIIPVIILAGLLADVAERLELQRTLRASVIAVAVFGAYLPYLNDVLTGTEIGFVEIVVGLPLAVAVAWGADASVTGSFPRLRRLAPAIAAVVALVVASPTLAHDPGQGEVIGVASLTAMRSGSAVAISVEISGCAAYEPHQIAARRAGQAVHAPLQHAVGCRFTGELSLPERGYWFVYAELLDGETLVETWIPVLAGDGEWSSTKVADLYAPQRPEDSLPQQTAGVVLYAVNLGLVTAVLALYRRTSPGRSVAVSG